MLEYIIKNDSERHSQLIEFLDVLERKHLHIELKHFQIT